MIDLDLNLAIFLVKFLKMTPERASRAVYFKEFGLFSDRRKSVLKKDESLKFI